MLRSQHQTAGLYATHFWLECRWIPVKALLDRLLTLLLVFNVIVAVVTVAIVAKLSVGKTFAISVTGHVVCTQYTYYREGSKISWRIRAALQFQTHRLCAVAGFSGPDTRRLIFFHWLFLDKWFDVFRFVRIHFLFVLQSMAISALIALPLHFRQTNKAWKFFAPDCFC